MPYCYQLLLLVNRNLSYFFAFFVQLLVIAYGAGDQIEAARGIHRRYRPTILRHAAFFHSLPTLSTQRRFRHVITSHQPYSGDWTLTN